MIKPEKNFLITGFFTAYIGWIIKRHFRAVEFNTPGLDNNRSILLIANHFSWWDGFLLYHLNRVFFKKKFHGMILKETMQKVHFFKYMGGFSVSKNPKEIIESLTYAAELLADPGNMVFIFPQGKLYSNFIDDVNFEKGAAYIATKAKDKFQYVLAATFIEYHQYKKPTANIYLKIFNVDTMSPTDLRKQYQQHYSEAKKQQTSIVV